MQFQIMFRGLAAALLLVLAGCAGDATRNDAVATAQDDTVPPYTIERDRRDLVLTADTRRVRIENPHGQVVVRNVNERLVGVYATVQRIGEHPEEPELSMTHQGDTAVVRVHYASDDTRGVDAREHGWRKGRVDLGVFVPKGLQIEVETLDDNIDFRRVDNNVHARSRGGRIVVAAIGAFDVATVSGDIRAWPMSGKWTQGVSIATQRGNIVADVPVYGEIDLEARARARLDVNFAVQRREVDGWHIVHFRNGGGSQPIRIRNDEGTVLLQHQDRPPTPL